jgi:hypothetical protein
LTCCISHTTCCWRRFIRVCDLFIYFHVHYYNNCFLLTQKMTQFFHAHRYIQIKKSFDDIITYIVINSKHWFTVIIMQLFGYRQHWVFFLNSSHDLVVLRKSITITTKCTTVDGFVIMVSGNAIFWIVVRRLCHINHKVQKLSWKMIS